MFKKIFGSKESTMSNAEVEKEMKVENGQKFGVSEDMMLYGGFQELNDYLFFEGLFVSTKNFKSKDGASVTFKSKTGDFTLPSSIEEFECDFSKPLDRHLVQISFDVTKAQIKKIQAGAYAAIDFKVKKKVYTMEKSK